MNQNAQTVERFWEAVSFWFVGAHERESNDKSKICGISGTLAA